jgi:hypothetical protein
MFALLHFLIKSEFILSLPLSPAHFMTCYFPSLNNCINQPISKPNPMKWAQRNGEGWGLAPRAGRGPRAAGSHHLLTYPAHILALGPRGEGLGTDNGAPSKKRPWRRGAHSPVLGPHHCGGQGYCVRVGLFIHLRKKSQP